MIRWLLSVSGCVRKGQNTDARQIRNGALHPELDDDGTIALTCICNRATLRQCMLNRTTRLGPSVPRREQGHTSYSRGLSYAACTDVHDTDSADGSNNVTRSKFCSGLPILKSATAFSSPAHTSRLCIVETRHPVQLHQRHANAHR